MVASRRMMPADNAPDLGEEAPPAEEGAQYERYTRPLDRTAAGIEGAPGHSAMVPLAYHEAFRSKRSMSKDERRELAIKQAALRIAAGLELRSLRELAQEIGCSHTAIDNMVARLCERLGMRKFRTSDATRARLRAARARQLSGQM